MSLADEYIELAAELFEDGADASVILPGVSTYSPATLSNYVAPVAPVACKLIFVSPNQSTQIAFENEANTEEFGENKVASVSYRGPMKLGAKIVVTGFGTYTVYAFVAVNPTGPTIYHRVKMGR